MNERSFATKFRGELRETLNARGTNHHLVTLYDAPRSGKKVYDSYMLIQATGARESRFMAIEFKSTKNASVSRSLPTDRQLVALEEVHEAGGSGWVIVHLTRTNQVLIVHAQIWNDLFGNFKSITIESLQDCQNSFLFLVDREKCLKVGGKMSTRWNLKEWLDNVE